MAVTMSTLLRSFFETVYVNVSGKSLAFSVTEKIYSKTALFRFDRHK